MEQPDEQGTDLQEVLAEMDDRTRVGWDAALGRVTIRRQDRIMADQARRIAELENAQPPATTGATGLGESRRPHQDCWTCRAPNGTTGTCDEVCHPGLPCAAEGDPDA